VVLLPFHFADQSARIRDFEPVRNARIERPLADVTAAVVTAAVVAARNGLSGRATGAR
jgi:hypothetical protein